MPHDLEERTSFTLSINQCTSQDVVLKRRHFQYALLSGRKRMGSNDEMENPETNKLILLNKVGPAVKAKSSDLEEFTSAPQTLLRLPRKYRMRNQYGDLLQNKGMARTSNPDACLPASYMSACNNVVLNVRSLKLETLNVNFRGPVRFTVDFIEIANAVRIKAFELTSCEWCRGHKLPTLFLHMTDAARWCLREQFVMSTDITTWDSGQSEPGKYLLIIFKSTPTVLEEAKLEEIFTEIGRRKNLNNFYVKLACEVARNRLLAHKHSPKELYSSPSSPTTIKSEVTTLNVSDSEDGGDDDDDDLIKSPSSNTQLVEKLVIYPPPPAKGGFSITNEDLGCLEEGKYLNDVIMDFYLKYLVCEKLQKEDANKCHVFSSFFYKSLTQSDLTDDLDSTDSSIQERRHNRVKTWTRHVDLFKKDFIFVPINQSAHWYLAVICFPGQVSHCSIMNPYGTVNEDDTLKVFTPSSTFPNPMSLFYRRQTSEQVLKGSVSEDKLDNGFCVVPDDNLDDVFQYTRTSRYACKISDTANKRSCILIMDSLNCGSRPSVVKVLQEYLEMEWQVKKGSLWSLGKQAMDGWSVQVPQQDNHIDCGVYVLQYVESFITNPPRIFHPAMDLRDWFPQKLVKKKREIIKRLIFRLHQQQVELVE